MRLEVQMPQLGESVVEGTITKWLVRPGDIVRRDQPLVEVATDKADSEVPSPHSGFVESILCAEGTTVKVGQALCIVQTQPDRLDEQVPSSTAQGPAPAPAPLDKEGPAPVSPAAHLPDASLEEPHRAPPRSAYPGLVTSPAVRRLAKEHEVDLAGIEGSGKRGRITRDDVLRVSGHPVPQAGDKVPAQSEAPTAPVSEVGQNPTNLPRATPAVAGAGYGSFKLAPYIPKEGDRMVAFSRRRRLIADHMTYSKTIAPHVVTVAEIDMDRTMRLREQHKDAFQKEGISLSLVAFIGAAVARALREFPILNARVLDDSYVILRDINLGIAVDTPDGLLVPCIRNADELSIRGLARAIHNQANRARDGKLTPDELTGSTFTVSNPGAKGNLLGAAVISQPNVAILRTGEIKKRVVVIDQGGEDCIAIHPVMYATLSYDHRIIDGVPANSFLWRVGEILRVGDFPI